MKNVLALALSVLLLTGCATASASPESPSAVAQVEVSDITDIDSGIAWARGLDSSVEAPELSEGIQKISEIVPDLDLWFQDNNEIGQALLGLNLDVLNDPDNAGTKADDLNSIIDDIEASIAKGNVP